MACGSLDIVAVGDTCGFALCLDQFSLPRAAFRRLVQRRPRNSNSHRGRLTWRYRVGNQRHLRYGRLRCRHDPHKPGRSYKGNSCAKCPRRGEDDHQRNRPYWSIGSSLCLSDEWGNLDRFYINEWMHQPRSIRWHELHAIRRRRPSRQRWSHDRLYHYAMLCIPIGRRSHARIRWIALKLPGRSQ